LSAFESKAVASITKAGGVVKQFPASELNKWKAAAPDTLAVWVKDMEGRGKGAMAAKVAKRWRELTGK
jgi:hypothetical protein